MAPQLRIDINYNSVDGYHIFTSSTVKGLYVISRDIVTAYDAVVPALKTILAHNFRSDYKPEQIKVMHKVEFSEFQKTIFSSRPLVQRAEARPQLEVRFEKLAA